MKPANSIARGVPWSRDEVILALSLYLEIRRVPEEYDPKVVAIARAIGRTPDSVVFKVANLRFLVTGGERGFKHTGQTDRKVWAEFKGKESVLRQQAAAILDRFSHTPEEEFEKVEESARGQGFLKSQADRKRIEGVAMEQAVNHFSGLGYQVEDVHAKMPYDLRCSRGTEEFFVEVKGTTGRGKSVMLTGGEVRFAKKHPGKMVLFVTHSIRLEQSNDDSNGMKEVRKPWLLDESKLTASSYTYDL